jgi:protein-tyrosine phosphatase
MYKIEQKFNDKPWIVRSWKVESAGTWAREGDLAADLAQEAMQEKGLDLRNHRSRRISRELLEVYDVVLTMEKNHKEALWSEFPDLSKRIHLLSEMVGAEFNIPDPIGGTIIDFREIARILDSLLEQGFDKICQLSESIPKDEIEGIEPSADAP